MPEYDICTRNKGRNIKHQTYVVRKWDESTKNTVGKTKIDRIRSQQISESYGIQPINQWAKRRREWDEHVTRNVTTERRGQKKIDDEDHDHDFDDDDDDDNNNKYTENLKKKN